MPEENVKLTSKHIAILRAFDDLQGHFPVPRKNGKVHYWSEEEQAVVFDLLHDTCLLNEPEWNDLIAWGLIQETVLGHPIYEWSEKANIYIG